MILSGLLWRHAVELLVPQFADQPHCVLLAFGCQAAVDEAHPAWNRRGAWRELCLGGFCVEQIIVWTFDEVPDVIGLALEIADDGVIDEEGGHRSRQRSSEHRLQVLLVCV